MGALEAPQDRHRQERRTGTSRAEQTGTMATEPPWPQHEEPPAPDESPWTRQDKVVKMFLWARQNRHTALLAVTYGLDPRG